MPVGRRVFFGPGVDRRVSCRRRDVTLSGGGGRAALGRGVTPREGALWWVAPAGLGAGLV
jgi:hypothetical protein